MIRNRRILVTGGAGSIGNELIRQLVSDTLYTFDQDETGVFDLVEELKLKGHDINGRVADVRDSKEVDDIFKEFKPDLVFHCAALKHVTPNESYPLEAIKTNVIGTYNMIEVCRKYGAKLVNISTDKVIHSNSVMGTTKKLAEIMVKNAGFVSVRFGNVLGSRGSVIPIWQQQADSGEPLTITDERMERFFMTIPQAVKLVIDAEKIAKAGQIIILDMGKPIKILDLAKQIIEKSGKNIGLKVIGVRDGETLTEKLMTDEELLKAKKVGNYYVI